MLDANDFEDRNLADSEEAITKAINYLKYKDPANANREYAVGLLMHMQKAAKSMASSSLLSFEEFVDQYNKMNKK